MRSLYMNIIIGAALYLCATANGQTAVENLIARVPAEAEVVVIAPDLSATLKNLHAWTEIALTNLPEETTQAVNGILGNIQGVSAGPVVVGIRTEPWSIIGFAAVADAQKTEDTLRQYGHPAWGLIALGPGDEIFCTTRDGILIFGNSHEAVAGDIPGGFISDDGMRWMLKSAWTGADLILLKKAGPIAAIEGAWNAMDFGMPPEALGARLAAMLGWPDMLQAPALLALDFRTDGFSLALTRQTLNPTPEEAALVQELSFPMTDRFRDWPIRLLVSGGDPRKIFDAVRAAEMRFDPDAGAEFDEEMTELNQDLGLDFRNDFLSTFGGNWAVMLRHDESPQWAAWCQVLDMQAALKGARGIARLSEVPWEETQRGGGAEVHTGTDDQPLVMLSSPDALALARSADIAQTAMRNDPLPKSTGQSLRLELTVQLSELGALLAQWQQTAMIGEFWSKLPPEAEVRLNYRELPFAQTASLTLSGITRQSIGTLLGPVVGGLHEAREAAKKTACMNNLRLILLAAIPWRDVKKIWPPNLDALVPEYVGEHSLICPSLGELPSYRFFGSAPFRQMGPGCPVIYDLAGNHADGRNVGFFDGHAQWMNEEAFQQMLREQHAQLKDSIEAAQKKGEPVEVNMPALEAFFEDRDQ